MLDHMNSQVSVKQNKQSAKANGSQQPYDVGGHTTPDMGLVISPHTAQTEAHLLTTNMLN